MPWWRWPKARRPRTVRTPRSAPPAPRGRTCWTGPGHAAACCLAATTTFQCLERGDVGVGVVVGQRHDDGLIDHIRRVGVALQKVSHTTRVEAGVLGAVGGGLALFSRVGGGNVIGQRSVIGAVRHRFRGLLLRVGYSERSRAFSDFRSLLSDSSSVLRCCRCKIWAIPAMLLPWATRSLMRARRSRSASL